METPIVTGNFPGGNIIVESQEGDVVHLRQDRRTTTEWWFYWCFRVQGAAGRTLRFQFLDGNVFGALGPCFSQDGDSWQWLGQECVEDNTFTYTFPKALDSAFFSFCIPYVEQHLSAFLTKHPEVKKDVLVTSEKGRPVEILSLESKRHRVLVPITARLHACETMGNYVLEGIVQSWLAPSEEGRFLREYVDLQMVPFFDKDGVEEGDQGKLRAPHDHNRDFSKAPHYVATRAWQERLASWGPRMALALDLHCPWIRGGRNEEIFFVGSPEPWRVRLGQFTGLLEEQQQGELLYRRANDIPHGEDWNTGSGRTITRYTYENFPVAFASTIEFPYALAGRQPVTVFNARAFGQDVGRTIASYLRGLLEK